MKLKGKDLPKWAPLAGIVVAGLLVALVGWKLVVSPQGKKAAALDAQTASVQQQIANNLAAVAAAKSTPTAPKIHVADVYKLAQAIPSTPDTPDLLIELSQITKDAGVDLQSLSPSAPTADAATGQQSVPIAMTVSGDFYTISDLLYRLRNQVFVRDGALEASGRLFSIDAVSLSPAPGGTEAATITMHTFVFGGGAAASTGVTAPPVTTDTTDTTSTDQSSGAPSAAGAP